ncbi:MAG: tetratricopeptide repeat protein, partial [Planctomycetes bacterium]|nr:tetratricopeptide repeat protein [Planctomycetota bacterium]
MSREPDQSSLLARALAPLAGLSAGVLCSQLSDFLKQVALVGGTAAVAGLSGPMTWTVLAVAGLFGVTESWRSSEQKKKARRLAERLDKLADRQDTALAVLRDIADGKTGVTLDGISEREFADRIIAGLHSAGLATTEQVARLRKELSAARVEDRIFHNTADLLLREIRESLQTLHATLGDRLPAPPPPNNNFTEAGIQPNLDFVGREQVLRDLHAQLTAGDVAITHAVSGEGGIGKTQVAIRYAFEHAADYDGRWWLDASKEALAGQIAALARTLGIPLPPNAKPEQIRGAVCERLSLGKHLLVLDNLEQLADLDGFTLPEPSRVLVTTRHTDLPTDRVLKFPLDVLLRDESLALLRKHRDDLTGPEHDKALSSVAEHLGDHALALALAASYLRKRPNVTAAELLERLQRADVGDKAHPFQSLTPEDHTAGYERSVYASLSLHLPDFRDTPAMKLLALAAHCHPDAIPLNVFFDASDEAQETVENQLAQLADVSIIRYAGTVSIHRLMQEVVRVELDETARRAALTALVGQLAARFDDAEDYRNWAGQDGYGPQPQAALAHAEALADIPRSGFLGNQLGLYLQNRARFDDALAALRTAERIDRAAFGDEHPEVATDVNNIGGVLFDKGDLDGALKCFREAE